MAAVPVVLDIELGAGRLRVEVRGKPTDPLLVCVPGLSANLRCFDALATAAAADGHRVAAVDLRGRGWSEDTPAGTYGWPAHARDVLALATALGADRFDLCGHSMGGFVAMETAHTDGSRLRRLVLVDALGPPEPESLPPILASVERLGVVVSSREEYLAGRRASGAIEPWAQQWTDYFEYELDDVDGGVRPRTSRAAVEEDAVHGAARDPAELWAALTMPTLLLRAERPVVPGAGHIVAAADVERAARSVPGLRVVPVDAAHYTIVNHADSVRSVLEFLR